MDPWLNEHERLTQLASEVSANIKDYHNSARNNTSVNNTKLTATIRGRLVTLTSDIARLSDQLPRLQITERERNRRKDMIFNLSSRKDQLSDLMSKPVDQVTSSGTAGPTTGKRAWGQPQEKPQDTEFTRNLDNAQLLQLQKDQMGQQDEHLDLLSNSIVKTKEIAVTINTELDVHTRLLDDLADKTNRVNYGIEKEREHIKKVSESAKVCGMWICIVVLIIIIIAFAATDWGCKIHYDPNRC